MRYLRMLASTAAAALLAICMEQSDQNRSVPTHVGRIVSSSPDSTARYQGGEFN